MGKQSGLKPEFIAIFCREYFVNRNITQSAIKAGWSHSTANARGYELLGNIGIQRELARLNEIELEKHDEVKAKIWAEYKKIAFTDTDSMFEYDEHGRAKMIHPKDMTSDQRSLIANMKSKVKFDKDGQPWYDFELIVHDKMKALEKMGQMIGAFKDVVDTNITSVDFAITKPSSSNGSAENDENPAIPQV